MENGLLVGAGLLALLLGTVMFNNDDDDYKVPDTPEPGDGSEDGTEGADIISSYDASQDDDQILSTYGGNDQIDLRGDDDRDTPEGDIDAGSGDDTVSLSGAFDLHIDGGEGNDTIDTVYADGATLVGGDGNDSISVQKHDGGDHNPATILGGAGDDLIHLDQIIATEWEAQYNKGPIISGGESADRFKLSVAQDGNFWDFDINTGEPLDIATRPYYDIATITDFTSGEDQLAIDATTYSTSGEYLGHEIIQSDDGESTGIMLQYTELNSIVWLDGTKSITEDDLQISAAEGAPLPVMSDGNDLIDSELGLSDALEDSAELRTLGGDDTISLEEPSSLIRAIDLGDGNDWVDGGDDHHGMLLANNIDAGAGNDNIQVRGNIVINGGEGSDTLTITDGYISNNNVAIDGGVGDDLISVTFSDTTTEIVDDSSNMRELTGGEGNDTFALSVINDSKQWMEDPSVMPEDIESTLTHFTAAQITDFTSGEDQLVIDTDYNISDQYIGHVFVPRADGTTIVVLRFVHPENPNAEARSFIRLAEGATITDDDLVVNSPAQTAA